MPSPFPGMNPWLEQDDAWHDFHVRFMPAAAESLTSQIGPEYFVKLEEHIYIHELPATERARRFLGRADVSVAIESGTSTGAASALLEAPVYGWLSQAIDVERSSYIEVRDRRDRQLVTVIELLSPANKRPGPDRDQYLAKRRQIFASCVHFVELDLLRDFPRLPIEGLPECDYYALVSQAETRPKVALWPVRLREPLPAIPIPLRSPEEPPRLDLQQLLNRVYDGAGYENYIYSGQPEPPLRPDDAAWAAQNSATAFLNVPARSLQASAKGQ